MPSIQQLVIQELKKNHYLLELLQLKLTNITAIAKKLQKSIEKDLGSKSNVTAISMAIRRSLFVLTKENIFDFKFPENLEISSKSQIYELAIARSEKNSVIAKKINEKFSAAKGDYISVIEGTYEIVIFTNQKHKKIIRKLISNCKITSEADNLAYITVNWENNTKDIPGIYYRITRALALKNISIQSFHTVGAEMMIFFKEEVFQDASQTILHLLKNSNEIM